ncbi:MAG: ribosome-associated translation inhibitor RaiA [Bacteroidota bacterium]
MQTRITARHFQASDGLRTHIEQSLSKLTRYYDGIVDAHVVLNGDDRATDKSAEVALNVYRQTLTASETGPSHEVAVDGCVKQLRRQVQRYKEKLRSTNKDSHR